MKAIIYSDLHLRPQTLYETFYRNKFKRILQLNKKEYDIVIISGDVVESSIINYKENPLDKLFEIFEKPIIFCLGNHEFAYTSHPEVLKWWGQWKHPKVHCLDIEGQVIIENFNFIGNVLWYDFTLNKCQWLMEGEIIDGWLDATIEDFDPLVENQKCKYQIFNNLSKDHKNILVTHMVPHIDLNTFSKEDPTSPFNAYSGCERFLLDLQDFGGGDITHAICGHTHRRECKEIWGINCINIGNDYFHRTGNYTYMYLDLN